MSEQDGTQATAFQHPTTSDPEAWRAFWQAQGQPWRTEPEINADRQRYLVERRNIKSDIDQGIYSFRLINPKLTRADIEWLLATHENSQGPVDWSDTSQRTRLGLDLRGANLSCIDLRGLPLACMRGGLTGEEFDKAIPEQRNLAGVLLEGADLRRIHLEGANLIRAHIERAALSEAYLEQANLRAAYLERATFHKAHLEQANLTGSHLDRVWLFEAHLAGANLSKAHLEGANLTRAHLEGKKSPSMLPPSNLRQAFFDSASTLNDITLGGKEFGFVSLVDVRWGNVNLAVVNWASVNMLGDEFKARQRKELDGREKTKEKRLNEYVEAVRANRQLAVALQGQGMNEQAARFGYRAQKLQRVVLRKQRKFGSYLFSLFLDLLAGYGYRPGRSVFWYLVIIVGFATAYYTFGHLPPFPDSFVFSLTSFHGRGFFPGLGNETSLHNPLVVLAAVEAVIGLFIEISFIATFTKRFFGS